MSKGLEALHHPRIKLASIDISAEGKHDIAYMPFYKTKQYAVIEKELKALDIIKEILPINEDDFYEENGKYYFIGNEVDKYTFYLLKEVLL